MTSKPRTPSWLHKLFRPTPPSTPTPSTSKLEKLPPEILSQITAYLPSSSRQILSITSRTLYRAIPPSYCILTRCAKYAVLCTLITSGLVKEKNLYACCLCKTRHSKQKFYPRAGHRGACGELGRDMLSRGPAERFCELHFPQTVAKLQDAEHDRWELREQRLCTHCCYLKLNAGICKCECEDCERPMVRTYMRLCTDVSKEIMYTMSRDEDGTLYVREGGIKKPIFSR